MIFVYILMLAVSIIFGSRSTNRVLGQMMYTCSRCRRPGYHTIVRSQRWFTLYFIPMIPLGKSTIGRCNLCGFQQQISNEQADSWFAANPPGNVPPPSQKTPQQLMDEATSHYRAGRYMEALAAYDQVLSLVPTHAGACYNKGNALFSLGRYEEAVLAYDRAIQLAPQVPDAYVAKGNALERLGRRAEAQQAYDQAQQRGRKAQS